MSMAKLNIWVSAIDDPCGVDDKHNWFMTIYDCDGNVLEWCGKKYLLIPAKCGHLEVEVPPGLYYISAVWGFSILGKLFWGNHFTHNAIVQACCENAVCVKLFNPSLHRCGFIFLSAVKNLAKHKLIKPDKAEALERLIHEMLKDITPPVKKFELGHLNEIEKLLQAQGPKKEK